MGKKDGTCLRRERTQAYGEVNLNIGELQKSSKTGKRGGDGRFRCQGAHTMWGSEKGSEKSKR